MKALGLLLAAVIALFAGCGVIHALQSVDASPIQAPESTRMLVTIPRLGITKIPTFDAPASDKSALTNGLMHVHGTGYPWQPKANVYLAGHDLGWPGTRSWHVFWNLRNMQPGDKVYVTDSDGNHYTYRVYKKFKILPNQTYVEQPVGKSIVTLQTCVPHWTWTKRLVVRAELVKVS